MKFLSQVLYFLLLGTFVRGLGVELQIFGKCYFCFNTKSLLCITSRPFITVSSVGLNIS